MKKSFDRLFTIIEHSLLCLSNDIYQGIPTSGYQGKTFYFCGPMCKLEFNDPKKYLTFPEKYSTNNQERAFDITSAQSHPLK